MGVLSPIIHRALFLTTVVGILTMGLWPIIPPLATLVGWALQP